MSLNNSIRLLVSMILNLLLSIIELVGGIFSFSLALISDAIHNLGDFFSILLSYIANIFGKRKQNKIKTFGYKRAEILAAFVNSVVLLLISLFIIVEAFIRILHPKDINVGVLFWTALVSFLINLFSTLLLHSGKKNNLNIKATYLHILSDVLASISVLVGSIIMYLTKIKFLDSLLTIVISIYIICETIPVLRKTIDIFMQSAPNLPYKQIEKDIASMNKVTGVHHLHAWMIDESKVILSVHVNMDDLKLSEVEKVLDNINRLLKNKYNICHVTIQPEYQHGKHNDLFVSNDSF